MAHGMILLPVILSLIGPMKAHGGSSGHEGEFGEGGGGHQQRPLKDFTQTSLAAAAVATEDAGADAAPPTASHTNAEVASLETTSLVLPPLATALKPRVASTSGVSSARAPGGGVAGSGRLASSGRAEQQQVLGGALQESGSLQRRNLNAATAASSLPSLGSASSAGNSRGTRGGGASFAAGLSRSADSQRSSGSRVGSSAILHNNPTLSLSGSAAATSGFRPRAHSSTSFSRSSPVLTPPPGRRTRRRSSGLLQSQWGSRLAEQTEGGVNSKARLLSSHALLPPRPSSPHKRIPSSHPFCADSGERLAAQRSSKSGEAAYAGSGGIGGGR